MIYLCLALIAVIAAQQVLHARERLENDKAQRLLMQRIQAPEVAVVEQADRPEYGRVEVISPLDDETLNKVKARGE